MSDRYEIVDILSQDEHGVVFQATDRGSGSTVVLRRFFPFGAGGGGLHGEEKAAYEVALRRLAGVHHPALRRVLDGGTDPVDGLPFLVTEWQEGTPLAQVLDQLEHPVATARLVAETALDASLMLSGVFQEEALWVESTAESIVLPHDGSIPGVTFWICPIRWLGDPGQRQAMGPLLDLIERVAGWRGRIISDTAGNGLGGWVNTLRHNPGAWTVAQAREALEVKPEPEPVAATPQPAFAGRKASKVARPKANPWPWIIAILLASATGTLVYLQKQRSTRQAEVSPPAPAAPAAPPAPSTAAKPAPKPPPAVEASPQDPEIDRINERAKQLSEKQSDSQLFLPGTAYPVEGEVIRTESSKSGATVYALVRTGNGHERWLAFRRSQVSSFDRDSIGDLLHKKVRATGEFGTESSRRSQIFYVRRESDFEELAP
ncbi:hypothetical protein [Haloferula sargassicola]|uniref:Protein kinase domain-containing protein n=1 Tax=Haloferula sargassicola TaxID=490096 RepID=A0ABP9ULW7_9BACT